MEGKSKKDFNNTSRFDLSYFPQSDLLSNSISKMFPEQEHEDKIVKRAKEVLGKDLSTENIECFIASFEYLIKTWFDEYEKNLFRGKTLKELLQSI